MVSCPSVRRLSVTLVDCDHTRWNSSTVISQMISLTFLLSADSQHRGYTPKGTPQNFSRNIGGNLELSSTTVKIIILQHEVPHWLYI